MVKYHSIFRGYSTNLWQQQQHALHFNITDFLLFAQLYNE